MTAVTFDTHEIVKSLKAAGFNDAQAEAVTSGFRKVREAETAEVATRADLKAAEGDLRLALAETKADILKWMFGAMAFQTLAVIGGVVAAARFLA